VKLYLFVLVIVSANKKRFHFSSWKMGMPKKLRSLSMSDGEKSDRSGKVGDLANLAGPL
jgi:hypothetical protein